jgi:hypothetical protein
MTVNLANTRRGIPRGGLRAPGRIASNSADFLDRRPAIPRGCDTDSPSL